MAEYEIWFGDDKGNRLGKLSRMSQFRYTRTLNKTGYFSIDWPVSYNFEQINISPLTLAFLRRDARIEIWRQNSVGVLQLEFLGLLQYYQFRTDENGTTILVLAGVDLNGLLDRRIIAYRSATAQATAKDEAADDLIKRLARENLGGSSVAARDMTLTGELTIETDLTAAPTISRSMEWKHLLSVCQQIAETSRQQGVELYFGIDANSPDNWRLLTRINQWGQDRTTTGDQGKIGLENGNLAQPELTTDWNDEISHVTAGGRGRTNRALETAENTIVINSSRFARKEGFKNASREDIPAAIQSAAEEHLEKNRATLSFSGVLVETKGFVFKRDWDFGDQLSWNYLGFQGNAVVKTIDIKVDGTKKETIHSRLETEE